MSKRWFDLIFTIIFAVIVVLSISELVYFGYSRIKINMQIFGLYLVYIIIVLALRRFFYNKEK